MKIKISLLIIILFFKTSYSETLQELIELAFKYNPQLKKLEKELTVLKSKAHVADKLPNPSFSLNFNDNATITMRQYIPWYEKLNINKQIEEKNYEVHYYVYKLEKNKIIRQIKENGYYIWLYREKIKTLENLENLIKDLINKTKDEDRLNVILSNIKIEKIEYQANVRKKLYELKSIVNFDFKDIDINLDESEYLHFEETLIKMESHSPLVKNLEKRLEREKLSYKLTKELYVPDVSLSINYKTKEDFKNAFSIGVGLSIYFPFWRTLSQEQSVLAQKLLTISHQEQKLELLNKLKYIISVYYEDYLAGQAKLKISKSYDLNYENSLKKAYDEYLKDKNNFPHFYIFFNEYKNFKFSILNQIFDISLSKAKIEELILEN